jgi:hypothetical protein
MPTGPFRHIRPQDYKEDDDKMMRRRTLFEIIFACVFPPQIRLPNQETASIQFMLAQRL